MTSALRLAAGRALAGARGSRQAGLGACAGAALASPLRAWVPPGGGGSGRSGVAAAAAAAAALTVLAATRSGRDAAQCKGSDGPVLVVGSLNADIIIEINRFPKSGETLNTRTPDTGVMVPGGKGANQAVAASRLSGGTGRKAQFVCMFGNDSHAKKLEQVLVDNKLDISGCSSVEKPSGQAFIFLEANGSNSILIVGGSNVCWPADVKGFEALVKGASCVLLQREIPEYINEAVADAAFKAGVPVVQDVGGEERPISAALLSKLSYLCPNETELERIAGMPTATEEQIVAAAVAVQKRGVKNVLVTLGGDGAILVSEGGKITRQKALPVPGDKPVDTTGAGDCFRAAFVVALVEGRPIGECLEFASAAGAITVSRMGAIPSLPTREECLRLIKDGKL